MTYILIFGALAFFAARLFGKARTISPEAVLEALSERQVATSLRREPSARAGASQAASIESGMPAVPASYLLGGSRAGAADSVAAVMDMMSGPGLLTPRDP